MAELAYTFSATFTDEAVAEEWLGWLNAGHVAEVLAGGATRAEIIALDGTPLSFEVRYHFPSREAFARYESDHAPRLRAEGVEKFPAERGVSYRRSCGVVLRAFPEDQR